MSKAFTILELLIVLAIFGIVGSILLTAAGVTQSADVQWGINGITETRCIDGAKFVVGQRGHVTQVVDAQGHAISCH